MNPGERASVNDAAVRHFDAQAGSYRAQSESGFWQFIRRHEADCVLSMSGAPAGLDVLDLGCGAGYYASIFNDNGAAEVHAVDLSEAMIRQLPDKICGHIGDITTIDLGRKFSLIVCAGALEFVHDPAAVFSNAYRHAAPGAEFIVLAPHANIAGRLYQRFHGSHGISIRLFVREDLEKLAVAAGWRSERIRHVLPFALVGAFKRTD